MTAIASLSATGSTGRRDLTKRSLSPARQRLVELAQQQLFGTIHQLAFHHGEPVFAPPPRVIRRVRLGGHNSARPQAHVPDFAIKQPWIDFFAYLELLQHGTVLLIEIAHGLPLHFEFETLLSG